MAIEIYDRMSNITVLSLTDVPHRRDTILTRYSKTLFSFQKSLFALQGPLSKSVCFRLRVMLAVQEDTVLHDEMHYYYKRCAKVLSFYSEMQRCISPQC